MRSPSGLYGMGLKPSTPSRIAHLISAILHPRIAMKLQIGSRSANEIAPCAMLDQGGSGTCSFHSLVAGIWMSRNSAGKQLPWVPSPLLLSSCSYADMQRAIVAPGQILQPLQDTGAELQDGEDAARSWGLGPMGQAIAGRGGLSDVPDDPPDNSFPEPGASAVGQPLDLTRLEVAGGSLFSGEYGIAIDGTTSAVVAACIDAGIPVRTGFYVDQAFESLEPSDVAQPANTNSPGGGHSTLLRAYRTASSGEREFLLRNSWGVNWAMSGEVWCSTAWLMSCWDLRPVAVTT